MTVVYRTPPKLSSSIYSRLQGVGVATTHESMESSGLMEPGLTPLKLGSCISGRAVTVSNLPGNNLGVHVGLEIAEEGDVLIITSNPREDYEQRCGFWGEVVTRCALSKGLAGVIADGLVRDAAAIRQTGFPVWSRGLWARAGAKNGLNGVNIPVECGGRTVHPGDVIVADDDGVVVVHSEDAEEVVSRAEVRYAKEQETVEGFSARNASTYRTLGFDRFEKNGELVFSSTYWRDGTNA